MILPKLGCIIPNLGMKTMDAISISNALFSKVQQRVLALIFGQPERSFYMSEIVRNVHSGTGAVERELSRLQRSGLGAGVGDVFQPLVQQSEGILAAPRILPEYLSDRGGLPGDAA